MIYLNKFQYSYSEKCETKYILILEVIVKLLRTEET